MSSKQIGELFTFKLRITIAIIVTVCGLSLISAYLLFPAHQDTIKFAAQIIAACAAIYSAFYVGIALKVNIARDKIGKSIEMSNLFLQKDFLTTFYSIDKELQDKAKSSEDDVYKKLMDSEELRHSIKLLLDHFEDMSLAIQYGYADETILRRSNYFVAKLIFDRLEFYIKRRRQFYSNNNLWCEYQLLVEAWRQNKSLLTGKPFE